MRCFSDVLKKRSPLNVFGDVSEKVKHRTNDASNDVSRPALQEGCSKIRNDFMDSYIIVNFLTKLACLI